MEWLGRWRTPWKVATEVTLIMDAVTSRAERGHLAMSPLLTRHPVNSLAPVTIAPCPNTTIHAWPTQHLGIARCQDFHDVRFNPIDVW